jgi:hypothetical protein
MTERWIVESSLPPQTAEEHLDYLIQHAVRCQMIARGSDDSDFTRSIVALGQEYTNQALLRGADPRSVPDPEQWRSIIDQMDRPRWP